jgi:hypothetical protein
MTHATKKQQPIAATGDAKEVQPGAIVEQAKPQPVSRSRSITAPVASPLDLPTTVFQAALERRKTNRVALLEWIRAALVEGVDYGRIHSMGKSKCQYAAKGMAEQCPDPKHWSKPSLWKPGAEKICGMLGVSVHYPTLQDYEQAALQGVDIKTVIIRCELRDATGRAIADGIGARSLTQDYGDLNKALKMAEKSAHIDATLRMAGLSEVFTQDLEDLQNQRQQGQGKERNDRAETEAKPIGKQSREHHHLEDRIKELKLDRERIKKWCQRKWGIEHFPDLTAAQYRELLTRLPGFAERMAAEAEASAEREATQPESTGLIDPYFSSDEAEQLAG